MLDRSENWSGVSHASAEMVIGGVSYSADRMEVITECDPSLRTMPLWECEARFNRDVSEAIGKVSVGQVVITKVTADVGLTPIMGGMRFPRNVTSCITMVVIGQRTEEDGSRSITARDARAVFDRDLVGFSMSTVLKTAVQSAITSVGLPVTVESVSGEGIGTSWSGVAIDRNPVPLSALVLDCARTNIVVEDGEEAVRLGGMPMMHLPKQTTTAETELKLVRSGVFGPLDRSETVLDVPDAVVMSWPSVRDDSSISSVTATLRMADRTVSRTITMGDNLVPVPVSIQTRCFGEMSGVRYADETVGRMAIWASAFSGMPEYRCRLIGNPSIQIGDRLAITTEDGTSKTFIVRKHSLVFEGDLMSDLVLLDDTRYIVVAEDLLRGGSDLFGTWKKVDAEPRDLVAILTADGNFVIDSIDGLPPTADYAGSWIIGRFPPGETMISYTNEAGTFQIKVVVSGDAVPSAVSEMSAEDFA